MDLDGYSRRAEAFTSELAAEHHRRFAGLTDHDGRAGVYQRHAELFSAARVDALRAAADGGDGGRRARALLRFAAEGHLAHATIDLDSELAEREAGAWLRVPGPRGRPRRLGYRDAALAQALEDDAGRRAELDAARRAVAREQLTPIALRALRRRRELTAALGWSSYAALFEQTTGVDLAALAGQAQALLQAGADDYRRRVDALAEAALPGGAGALRRSDLPWLLEREPVRGSFPARGLTRALAATLAELGIDVSAQRGLVVDVAGRQGKSPRAFCAAVRVPEEVYLVVPPRGGRRDYEALMHEAGHAQHFAATDPELPFELRRIGDPAVGEAFAFLFEGLVAEPDWLRRHLGIDAGPELVRNATARKTILVRRYAAKLGHELALHGPDPAPDAALAAGYARRLEAALQLAWPSDTWLTDVDPGLYVVSYLRAWALEAGLRRWLRAELGGEWFSSERAGALLAGLWRQGQRWSAEELLERVQPGARLDLRELVVTT